MKAIFEEAGFADAVRAEALRQMDNETEENKVAIKELMAITLSQAMSGNPRGMLHIMAGPKYLNSDLMAAMQLAFAEGIVVGRRLPE